MTATKRKPGTNSPMIFCGEFMGAYLYESSLGVHVFWRDRHEVHSHCATFESPSRSLFALRSFVEGLLRGYMCVSVATLTFLTWDEYLGEGGEISSMASVDVLSKYQEAQRAARETLSSEDAAFVAVLADKHGVGSG